MALGRLIRTTIRSIIDWACRDEVKKERYDGMAPAMPSGLGGYTSSGLGIKSSNVTGNGMNFNVYPATGGKVIEFKSYDPVRDTSRISLYVITDKEDLGEELGQIITKESLTR